MQSILSLSFPLPQPSLKLKSRDGHAGQLRTAGDDAAAAHDTGAVVPLRDGGPLLVGENHVEHEVSIGEAAADAT